MPRQKPPTNVSPFPGRAPDAPPNNPEGAFQAPQPSRSPKDFSDSVGVSDLAVIVGYKDRNGVRQETIFNLATDDITITKCKIENEQKTVAIKEDGQIIAFEPTGEHILKIEAKYIKD